MLKSIYPHRLLSFVHTQPFGRLSDIMRLHSRHLMHILLRVGTFSREDYQRGAIPIETLIYCIVFGLLTWTTIVFGVAVFLQWMPAYSAIMGIAVGVSHYDRFSLMGTTSFLLMEYLWYEPFSRLMFDDSNRRRRYPPLELLYEYEEKLDAEIDAPTRRNFIRWYSRAHLAVITYLHCVWTGIAVQTAYMWWLVLRHFLHGHIGLFEVPLYIFLSSHSHFLGAFSVVISSTFYTDLFFLVKVFKYKLARCFTFLQMLRLSPQVNPFYLQRFDHEYMHLHRQLNGYNAFSQKLIYMCDLIFKCAGSITFSFFAAQQGEVKSSTTLMITTMFLISYAGLQLVFTYLAFFPEENLRTFKAVAGIAAKNSRNYCSQYGSHNSHSFNSNIRPLLKLNMQVQFLAKNKFAFTYTSHYCIQKTNIIENVFANFYFLTLFYRKFV